MACTSNTNRHFHGFPPNEIFSLLHRQANKRPKHAHVFSSVQVKKRWHNGAALRLSDLCTRENRQVAGMLSAVRCIPLWGSGGMADGMLPPPGRFAGLRPGLPGNAGRPAGIQLALRRPVLLHSVPRLRCAPVRPRSSPIEKGRSCFAFVQAQHRAAFAFFRTVHCLREHYLTLIFHYQLFFRL